ncbi:acyltransferase [Providencia stuartii]|uniref:acyltransferase n=1 Tax=Providencia stuartii TaxID=588 RepID=UPI0004F63294|nr:bacterial transferase hexapeptide family protein [Providencia stuartii]
MINPFNPGYFNEEDLKAFGFKSIGENVSIAKNCTIVGLENITIGDNVRIDGYSTIIVPKGGWLYIGSHIHIGGYSFLSAGSGIELNDFSGLSQGVKIYSRTDDYSGEYLTNPMIPSEFTGVQEGTVILEKHVIVGSGSVILPNVEIGEGSSVGAQSLVMKNLESWGVYFGSPVKKIKSRSKKILELESKFLSQNK